MKRLEPLARERCIALIEELRPKGGCDMTVDFAMLYATEMFLAILGLPVEDGAFMLPRVETIFRGFFGGDPDEQATAANEIKGYFERLVEDRAEHPRDVGTDFVSYLLQTNMGSRPITHDEILTLCMTIMLAGLDTTRSMLGYIFHHLATHEADRQHADRRAGADPRRRSRSSSGSTHWCSRTVATSTRTSTSTVAR